MEYKLSKEAYNKYISITNNKDASFVLAEVKLNRNLSISRKIKSNNFIEVYQYGTLVIEVSFGEIINVYKVLNWTRIRDKKKHKANYKYGLLKEV